MPYLVREGRIGQVLNVRYIPAVQEIMDDDIHEEKNVSYKINSIVTRDEFQLNLLDKVKYRLAIIKTDKKSMS